MDDLLGVLEGIKTFMVDDWREAYGHPGAMFWRNHEYREHDELRRPMPHLSVMTPAGLACLDCPSSFDGKKGWMRFGNAPNVTVTPSLNINPTPDPAIPSPSWHGSLMAGYLK